MTYSQISENFGKTIKILEENKIDIFDLNILSNGFLEKYTEGIKGALMEYGSNWRVITGALLFLYHICPFLYFFCAFFFFNINNM